MEVEAEPEQELGERGLWNMLFAPTEVLLLLGGRRSEVALG